MHFCVLEQKSAENKVVGGCDQNEVLMCLPQTVVIVAQQL